MSINQENTSAEIGQRIAENAHALFGAILDILIHHDECDEDEREYLNAIGVEDEPPYAAARALVSRIVNKQTVQ